MNDNSGKKLTYDYVNQFFKKNNCQLISKNYKNARTHLEYICSCGNVARITFDSFSRGHRCKKCAIKKQSNKQKLDYNYVKNFIDNNNCKLLSEKYENAKSKLKIQCYCGEVFFRSFNNFKSKKQNACPKCALKKRSGHNHYEWIDDREELELRLKIKNKSYKMIKYILKSFNIKKTKRTHTLLGYTNEDLVNHIISHSNWINIKDDSWHIDHIFPIKAFLDHGIKDLQIINSLDNLQPLSSKDNLSKGANYDLEDFKKWLKNKGINI